MGIGKTKRQQAKAVRIAARRVFSVLVLGVLIVGSMYLYNHLTTSDTFAIEIVEFKGVSRMEPDDVDKLLSDLHGQNILLAPLDSYEERLKMHPRIERVSMKRVLPNKVMCSIEEREPVALVFTDHFLEVDRHGMVMGDDEYSALLDLPIITGVSKDAAQVGKISSDPLLRRALEALNLCKNFGGAFAADISELKATSNGISIRSLRENCVLVLGESDFENRLRKYFLLKDTLVEKNQNTGLIDLRFEDQIVLRSEI